MLKKKLFKNLGWKMGGLLLACALWFHLTTEQEFHKEIMVDIHYINIADELVLTPESQKSAIINITTNGKKLFKLLYFDNIEIIIDLADYTSPGAYSQKFTRPQLTIPTEMTGVQIEFIRLYACDFELIPQ